MASDPRGHDVAPVALLRAAAFPLQTLSGLGDADLSRLARSSDPGSPDPELVAAHARAMAREWVELRSVTVEDPAFMKALMIANPQLARTAAGFPGKRTRKLEARARRLRVALFRHLSRAVGRTEPADLWAGVAMLRWSKETTVREVVPKALVHPDLRPFQAMLRAMATRPPYLWTERRRVNATLIRRVDGRWRYSTRLPDGRVEDRVLEPNPAADRVIALLPNRGEPLEDLSQRLAAHLCLDGDVVRAALQSYVAAGVLVGGLDLPNRFSTPWEALERAGARLVGQDGDAWHDAVATLRRMSTELECGLPVVTAAAVADIVGAAESVVQTLATRLGVHLEPPRAVLRCDLHLPFDVTLGADELAQIVTALGRYDDTTGPPTAGAILRSELEARTRARIGPGRPLAEAALDFRSARTGLELGSATPPRTSAAPAGEPCRRPPVGSLMVALLAGGAEGGSETAFVIRGVFDEVAPLYGRFSGLVGDGPHPASDLLSSWLRQRLACVRHDSGLRLAELAGPCEANPNALAGPNLTDDVFELWSTTEAGEGLSGAEVHIDPVVGSPVLRLPGGSDDLVLFSFSSADLARDDRVSELLLATSARLAPTASFEAQAVLTPPEPKAEPDPPDAAMPRSPAQLRPRRTVLSAETVQELRAATGPELYRRWQHLAAQHEWPALVRVRTSAGEHALLMPSSSPLAVEAVLGRLSSEVTRVVVEDASQVPWLTDHTGARYVSELAVPFSRSRHLWSERTAGTAR